jgi:predicted ATPase/DNA-binding CsgD family transcriptional regulator
VPNTPGAPLFGRAADLREIRRLLAEDGVRVLTLTGAGGTGKTRLAQALVSEDLLPGRSTYFVDLAVVDDAADVPASIAHAIGVQEAGSEPVAAILRDVMSRTVALLVLDNFERVLGAARFVADLLAASPDLRCLVTSREPMHIRAERVFPVAPLPVPDVDVSDLATLAATPSVALFVDRGQARKPDFKLTPENGPVVSEICRRLDGLPLAIELAAAQVSVLSPHAIRDRLEARAPFVLGGARDLPARHQTLRAAEAWSYDLLDLTQRLVFRRCGVFSGAFAPIAVAALIDPSDRPGDPLDTLAQLADKNLVQVADATVDTPHFRLLETLRAFALDLLTESGELVTARQRHAEYFLSCAERSEKALVGPQMGDTLDRLEYNYDNFRAVLNWSLDGGDLAIGLRLAGALYRFWMLRGHLGEARQWLERALPRSQNLAVDIRAKGLNAAGVLAGVQGDNAAAETFFRESFRLWQTVGNPIRMAAAMGNLGLVAQERQDVARALACFQEAEQLYAQGGDRRGIAVSMGSRAHLARQEGSTLEAVRLFEDALALFREVGDPHGTANSLANLGHAMVALRQPQQSVRYFREALELRRSLGNTLGIAECLEGFAAAAAARRQGRRAARLLGAAAALRGISGAPLPTQDRRQYEQVLRRMQQQLSPETLEREQSVGRGWDADQAADYALLLEAEPRARSAATGGPASMLTERERQVAVLVARGMTNQQIADTLLLARRTIGTHLEHIFAKLGVQARAEVAVWITQHDAQRQG